MQKLSLSYSRRKGLLMTLVLLSVIFAVFLTLFLELARYIYKQRDIDYTYSRAVI